MTVETESAKKPITAKSTQSSKGFWIGMIAVAAVVVTAGGYYVVKRAEADNKTKTSSDDSASDTDTEKPLSVPVTHLSPGGIVRTSTQIGSVQPFEEADLYAKVSGYLSVLNVDYGDRVKKDQELAVLSDPEVVKDEERAEADLLQAKAAVQQMEAALESAKADREALGSVVEQTAAEVDRYVAMRTYHEKKYARYLELVKKQAVPQEIADEEEQGLESARASEFASKKAVLSAKSQYAAAGARVKKAEVDILEAKANVEVASAKLDRAKVFVSYMKITSPYDGVITKRNYFPGAFIRSASEGGLIPLLTVARTDKLRVVTMVPDRDVPFTTVGDEADIMLDALPGKVFKAKVSRFAEAEDLASRTMHTEIDVMNPDNVIRAGMYGIAKIILDQSTKMSTLPSSCLVSESKGGNADVFVIKDGKAKTVRVAIGADDGIRVDVLSGLKPEDEVITNNQSVSEGIAVKAQEVTPAANKQAASSDQEESLKSNEHH